MCKSLSGFSNEDDSNMMVDIDEGSSKSKNKVGPGSVLADPQSIYAKVLLLYAKIETAKENL